MHRYRGVRLPRRDARRDKRIQDVEHGHQDARTSRRDERHFQAGAALGRLDAATRVDGPLLTFPDLELTGSDDAHVFVRRLQHAECALAAAVDARGDAVERALRRDGDVG